MSANKDLKVMEAVATYNMHDAKSNLSRLVDQAAAGKEIIIAKAGKPVARLVPLATARPAPRKLGLLAGKYDVPDDIDTPFADEIERMFGGYAPALCNAPLGNT